MGHGAAGMGWAGQGNKLFSPWAFSKESVPVSSYQQAGVPADLKRRIARLGISMLLKMVSSWAGLGARPAVAELLLEMQGLRSASSRG